jgi:hypothetical protein
MKIWIVAVLIQSLVIVASINAQRCNAPDEHLYGMQTDSTGRFFVSTTTGLFVTPCLSEHTVWEKSLPPFGDTAGLSIAKGRFYVATIIGNASLGWRQSSNMGINWEIESFPDSNVNIGDIILDENDNAHGFTTEYSVTRPGLIYGKSLYHGWSIDTAGYTPTTRSYGTAMGSDRHGRLYVSGVFPGGARVMRRPMGGPKWVADVAGLPQNEPYFTQFAAARDGRMLATGMDLLYMRDSFGWVPLSSPEINSSKPGGISIDSNNTVFCVYSGQYLNGLYYTKDFGITWAFTGLEGKTVWSLMSFGDTTFVATDDGIYKMTIPTSVVVSSAIIPSAITNYPNPFYAATTFRFTLPTREHVILTIRDILGHEVARLVDGVMDAGEQQLTWSVGTLPVGVYVVEVRTDAGVARRPVTLIR